LDFVELEIDIALRIAVEANVDHMAIFIFGFLSNVILQFLDPCFTFFPVENVSLSES
jgi:hypothetical protein